MLHLDQVRLLAAGILYILTLALGTLPVYLLELINRLVKRRTSTITITPSNSIAETSTKSKWFQHDRIVQFLTQIGGGVLFYTAFIHMLPEIRENYESYLKNKNDNHNTTWPGESNKDEGFSFMPESIVDVYACVGLFGMFLLEELMHLLLGDQHNHHNQTVSQEQNHRSSQKSYFNSRRFSLRQCMEKRKYTPQIDDEYRTSNTNLQSQDNENGQQTSPKRQINTLILPLSETHPISSQRQTLSYNTCGQSNCDVKLAHHHGPNNQPIQSRTNDVEQVSLSTINDNVDEQNFSILPYVIENFLLILAFSCHSLFDGISIGVQESEKEIWTMLIAILSHKLLIAFILSFQIYEKCQYKTIDPTSMKLVQKPIKFAKLILWIFSTLFALMSPLGIIIVIFMNNITSDQNRLDIIILAAVSAGTILYIVFLEIIDKLHSRTHINGIVQWIALAIGFLIMNIISQLFQD